MKLTQWSKNNNLLSISSIKFLSFTKKRPKLQWSKRNV